MKNCTLLFACQITVNYEPKRCYVCSLPVSLAWSGWRSGQTRKQGTCQGVWNVGRCILTDFQCPAKGSLAQQTWSPWSRCCSWFSTTWRRCPASSSARRSVHSHFTLSLSVCLSLSLSLSLSAESLSFIAVEICRFLSQSRSHAACGCNYDSIPSIQITHTLTRITD